jgi:hypothetical protein
MSHQERPLPQLSAFQRGAFASGERATRIGAGEIGGKASNLVRMWELVRTRFGGGEYPQFDVTIPTMTVVSTAHFDAFLDQNGLHERLDGDMSDAEIALAFQQAELPVTMVGDLRSLVEEAREPLAVRSSSRLEDALARPFAGVFLTKMIPNNEASPDVRFRKLSQAIKLVYASPFLRHARRSLRAFGAEPAEEKMAVVLQEVVGRRFDGRFYPQISGVARSFNFYPQGRARPEDGVVDLALGLGRTIVDGGLCWTYVPRYPRLRPPFSNAAEMLESTQTRFWAVNMGRPPAYDPTRETEYLVEAGLAEAESDGTLTLSASTYDAASDRLSPGLGRDGPRVLDFAPLLQLRDYPLNDVIRALLEVCEESFAGPVEIEFAVAFDPTRRRPARFGFLQVRPMAVDDERVDVPAEQLAAPRTLVASERALGNGESQVIRDVVYVRPDRFESRLTPAIAEELADLNEQLVDEDRPYLLIGFGRWGSSDPWLGIPIGWSQISGARALVEATLPTMNVELSQGSHLFHNLSSLRVSYLSVRHDGRHGIDWEWLAAQPAVHESESIRHVRTTSPLAVRVDGRSGRGVILRPE